VGRRKNEKYLGFGVGPDGKSPGRRAAAQIDLANMAAADADMNEEIIEKDTMLRSVEARDLMEFGLIPEFCGRFPVVVPFQSLNIDLLVRILREPRNSLIAQYKGLFKIDTVDLQFTEDAMAAIARLALSRKTGARGLRAILEDILLEPMFETPRSDVVTVTVTADAVNKTKPVEYARRPQQEQQFEEFASRN